MTSFQTFARVATACLTAGILAGCVSTGSKTICTSTLGEAKEGVDTMKLLNARFHAAELPNGKPALVTVGDHYPGETGGDGVTDVLIPWSEAGDGKPARLIFSKGTIGTPTLVKVTCAHFQKCRVRAFDPLGNLVDDKKHILGKDKTKTFTFKAPTVGIKRIEFIGAEIVMTELCVTAAGD